MFNKNNIIKVVAAIISATLQAISINYFIVPSKLLSGGFSGLSLLTIDIFKIFDINLSLPLLLIAYNIPAAILCFKAISKKFVYYSLFQIALASLLIELIPVRNVLDDIILSTIFGGILLGLAIVIALKANLSTGGTDFIALYVSNKINRAIFNQVFIFNAFLLIIFGIINGWFYAGYSILFQFIVTYVVNSFYKRYERVTLQIIIDKDLVDDAIKLYCTRFNHGSSVVDAVGATSKKPYKMVNTVVSIYEQTDVVKTFLEVDDKAIINVFKTTDFYGSFYIKPID